MTEPEPATGGAAEIIDDDDVEVLQDTPTTMILRVISTGQILHCTKHGAQ